MIVYLDRFAEEKDKYEIFISVLQNYSKNSDETLTIDLSDNNLIISKNNKQVYLYKEYIKDSYYLKYYKDRLDRIKKSIINIIRYKLK
jgi:hypothetical protein